jgi:hypothetical protein
MINLYPERSEIRTKKQTAIIQKYLILSRKYQVLNCKAAAFARREMIAGQDLQFARQEGITTGRRAA